MKKNDVPSQMIGKEEVIKILKKEGLPPDILETPPSPEIGDFALPCFTLAKVYKKSPQEIAKDLAIKIKPRGHVSKIEANGPYLNFFIDKEYVAKTIIESKRKKPKVKKTILVEFSSPNVMKPFSIPHLRSTMIGNAIAHLYTFLGYRVVRINHLGDWGTQFGKMGYAFEAWGNEKELRTNPFGHMLKLYTKFHTAAEKNSKLEDAARAWFARLEKGDKKQRALWKKFRTLSLKEYAKIYTKLHIRFDSYAGEAFYEPYLKQTIDLVKKKGFLKESEGAFIVDLEPYGLTPCILQKADGSSIYATRDLAAAIYRYKKYRFDENLYIVDTRQSLHFQQVFKIIDLLGYPWGNSCKHIPFGIMTFQDEIMSTRKGTVILLEDVLDEATALVAKIIQKKNPKLKNKKKVAEDVGISAVIFWDLSHDRTNDIAFSWEKVLDFNGETGPYVQYTYARAASILRKAKKMGRPDYAKLTVPIEQELLRELAAFEETVQKAAHNYKPSILAKYVITVCQRFNEFYQQCPCIQEKDKTLAAARLRLVNKTKEVIRTSLTLLGMSTPEQM